MTSQALDPTEAVLIASFGGPEGRDDVLPFLDNVLAGRDVPLPRKLAVAEHYFHFDGVSPINAANRELVRALSEHLSQTGHAMPVFWGNRNWTPYFVDALGEMRERGITRAYTFVTSALSSYSGCRQYWENLEAAQAKLGQGAPQILPLRRFYNHPLYVRAVVEQLRVSSQGLPCSLAEAQVIFTAHSLPTGMSQGCDYVSQLEELARLVSDAAGVMHHRVAYQSRSGPPSQPWLGPDISDALTEAKAAGVPAVVVCPAGFVSDHMEVVWDLDVEAADHAKQLNLPYVRSATAGGHPDYIAMIADLIEECRQGRPGVALGRHGARVNPCVEGCCPRAARPVT